MPLSEHEQRLLEQLEQQLHADDPKFASSMESASARAFSTRRLVIGALVTIVGILVLLFGVSNQIIALGVAGFVVMGAGVYYATARGRITPTKGAEGKPAGGKRGGFMSTLEEKWDERHREQ
jgi:hypothetical protein